MKMTSKIIAGAIALSLGAAGLAYANSARDAILQGYAAQAGGSFSAQRGKDLFMTNFGTGKPATPSCSTCHTSNPTQAGKTRIGKVIAPMAVSRTPDRFTDPAKVEKWFRRNCKSVIGRECTAQEKGDFITYMSSL